MDRGRSSLSRHRRRRLQEATQHVSAARELAAPAAIARQRRYSPRGDGGESEAVNTAVRVLRNAKNGVYHRGLAARALGLIMLHDPEAAARLRFEAEDLVDALLQLVNYCRHASVQNADTRRVHVNCCLVISLLMQGPDQVQQPRASMVVALDSELLVMESKPAEASSSFLLLTISGRPESDDGARHASVIDGRSPLGLGHDDEDRRKATKAMAASPTRQSCVQKNSNQQESPPKQRKAAWPPKVQEMAQSPVSPQPPRIHPVQQVSPPTDAITSSVAGRSTPARVFKMDRFRVVTPAFASATARQHAAAGPGRWSNSPVINPTGGCDMDRNAPGSFTSLASPRTEESPPSTASPFAVAPPSSASLMHPQHMLEILRTQQMPITSPAFFTRRLRESISRQASSRATSDFEGEASSPPVNRLPVVTWGEWKHQRASRGADQTGELKEEEEEVDREELEDAEAWSPVTTGEQRDSDPSPVHSSRCSHLSGADQPPIYALPPKDLSPAELSNTPEAKRQRLRDILASPIEPSEENALHLRTLARRVDLSITAALDTELQTLAREERDVREQLHTFIQDERDRLPLKFLFALPGGAAYCRQRMRRAMALWLFTFEQNQRRLALLQWKAVVERGRFVERGAAYHARAVQMRLKVAIAFVLRNFQQQALRRWVLVTQAQIWLSRDQAVRMIQTRARQFMTRQRTLRAYQTARFGCKSTHALVQLRDDVYLAPPRSSVKFRIPLEIREDMCARWRAATSVQRRLRRRRFSAYLSMYRVAATKIQSVARMRAERTRFAAIRKQIIAFQARVRMVACRGDYLRLRDAALLVQRAFRDSRARRLRRLVKCAQFRLHEHKLTAALLIQRFVRGFAGRREAQAIRRENAERFHAALVVQRAWYRRNNEFSTFLLLGCLREQEGEDMTFGARVLAFKRATSANRIRRAWAAYLSAKRDLAARRIQREARGLIARQRVAMLRRRRIARRRIKWFLRVRHAERVRVAYKIQFAWLRAVPGRLVRHLKALRTRMELLDARRRFGLVYDSASRIQALARGYYQGRKLARRERSARTIQRAFRAFIHRKRRQELMARLRAEAAERAALQLLDDAVRSVAARRLRVMNAAAVQVQRVARGFVTRSRLVSTVVRGRREQQMASRIQRIWRENAWRRAFAQRAKASRSLLEAQRRRQSPTNPFRDIASPARVLERALQLAGKFFDPRDDICGISVHEWLWRNGLSARYGGAFQKRSSSDSGVDSALLFMAQLRELDAEACGERLYSIMTKASAVSSKDSGAGVDDAEVETDVDALVTNLLASRTLREARELRRELARDQKRHQELFQADSERRRKQLAAAENTDLQQATRAVEQAKRDLEATAAREEAHAKLLAGRRDEFHRDVAPQEAAARASLDGFRVLSGKSSGDGAPSERDRVARALFLERFPGLEARAATFSSALAANGGARVTRTQLARFLGLEPRRRKELTLTDVKLAMPELTHFKHADSQRQHDLLRFAASADVLQLGLERLGELFSVSLEELALGRSRGDDADSLQSRVAIIVVDALQRSRARPERLPPAEQRARALRDGIDAVMRLHNAAVKLQTRWRVRAGRKLLLALRRGLQRAKIKAEYVAERSTDHVTPLWEREREREREEAEAFAKEQARLARFEALAVVPRFPFVFRSWSYELDVFVYRKQPDAAASGLDAAWEGYGRVETEGEDYELEARHSTYSLAEDAAATKIQARARGWLARRLVAALQRAQRRQRRRDALEREWDAARQERAQLVTLTMGVAVAPDARVTSWRHARRRQTQSKKPTAAPSVSRTRRIRAGVDGVETDGVETDEALDARVARVERAYHRSARSEHRREWNFPAAARAPDAHGRALLELLRAFKALQRSTAPRGCVSRLSLRYTKAATRFGWWEVRQSGGGPRFFVHAASGESSWDPPPAYSFEESAAATTIQALARQLAALRERERMLDASSLSAVVGGAVARVQRLGAWTGTGLEGLTPAAALCLVGLARLLPSLSAPALAKVATADELRAVPAEVLRRELQWSADDVAALQLLPEPDRRVKAPRSDRRRSPAPTAGAAAATAPVLFPPELQFLPSARVVAQLVGRRFPSQQGRAQVLARAVAASRTPITHRQLEAHLRRYGGRPDEAAGAAAMRELADLAPLARTVGQARAAFYALARALDRAIVLAANLRLRGLQRELSAARGAVWALVQPAEDANDTRDAEAEAFKRAAEALPLCADLSERELAREKARALALPPVLGLWEAPPPTATERLSPAQAARFVRESALARVLAWDAAARRCQSLARMRPVRARFLARQRSRRAAAEALQRVFRGHGGRAQAARLAAQRASDWHQARDSRSGELFVVFAPTRARLADAAPVDAASGRALPVRPLVRDRRTQRWLLAWPQFSKRATAAAAEPASDSAAAFAVSCVGCRAARAARRCGECASAAGDFLDLCVACFADAHAGHGFSALARAAAAPLRCVECRRPSTRRCLPCAEHFCARCFLRLHARGLRRAGHRCEVYAARAAVCADCEARAADCRCLDCRDALCAACLARSHAGGGRAAHALERIVQPLEDPAREQHCAQCRARRGDARCAFCAALLCAVCALERREPHARACPGAALELARAQALGPDARCAECGRPADRECAACGGDRYCSARWMGHAGCFERFHARGRRATHQWREWAPPAVEPAAAAALAAAEQLARARRREDARRAETEAAALAAALRADGLAEREEEATTEKKRKRRRRRKARKSAGGCAADGCEARAVGPALPLCARHLTPQLALEAAEGDPLQAAKLLADAERNAAGGGGGGGGIGIGKRLARVLAALRPTDEDKRRAKKEEKREAGEGRSE